MAKQSEGITPAHMRGIQKSALNVKWGNGESLELSQAELSKVFGCTPQNIRQWENLGMPYIKGGHGIGNKKMYRVADCVKWRVEYDMGRTKDFYGGSDQDEDVMQIDEARRRKEVALALQAELALAKEREQVANIDDIMAAVAESLSNCRGTIMAMKSKLSGLLAYKSEDVIEAILDKEITEALTHISEYFND